MNLKEAKQQFVQAWGALGTQWGINKTMAQIHALLLLANEPLSTEDIMEQLSISRGNANMNVRELMEWALADKVFKFGERKDYFIAEKDVWKIARQVAKIRKKRELEPIIRLLEQIENIEGIKNDELKAFVKIVHEVRRLAVNAERLIDGIVKSEDSWFWDKVFKLFSK
ncbi:MAG: transcriptional regulator [Bacteroidota bacterium]|nr:transcriptional regulator [Bacteroidota bacterium]